MKMFHDHGFTKIGEDIYLYKNFISEEECANIVSVVESLPEESWHFLDENTYGTKRIQEVDIIKQRFSAILGDTLQLGKNCSVVRMDEGAFCGDHSDDYDFKDSSENIVYGSVMYFNSFEGGEIYYRTQGIVYKPNPGDLLIHSAKVHCLHGVKAVKSGPRYSHSNHIVGI